MTTFILIRHATTIDVGTRLSGRKEGVVLTETGVAEADALAQRLSGLQVAALYSSPMERAQATAAPLAQVWGKEVAVMEAFNEIDFGAWTQAQFSGLHSDPQFALFNQFRSHTRIPGGETMLEAQCRMVQGLQQLMQQHPQQKVAIVSHCDMIKAVVAYYLGMSLDHLLRLDIEPASVTVLTVYPETTRLQLLNHRGAVVL
ncbi:probable phosphoglycerate mutase [Cnuella takakiae]|uniref:Probable phosphoglycerate mutase n=1 Tax=Cnuella takakiae TaxID=1302690 RepID=A0A1M4VD68_9BACT|nr:histidine phosphatase family protein [Cnuella takakiae]OLY94817.1 hypothetical protein BUE76_12605 [Cnuella takakiae]SHE66863.1 probable phosphoglycerate mutase [Cnuella takakiae]